MTEQPTVLFEKNNGVATITLNRESKLNALTLEMLDRLGEVFDDVDADKDVRVVLFRAEGSRSFCAGADIHAWSALEHLDMWRIWIRRGIRLFDRLAGLRQPTIAVIRGIAYGGGLEIALACDMRIASDKARFALPEVTIGTGPGWAGTGRLPRLIGTGRAKQMIFTGQPIGADKAEAWGLINESVADEALDARAVELAETIARNAPISVQVAKQAVDAGLPGANATLALEGLGSAVMASTEDAKEGFEAFRERRAADFKGK